jgi:hypothetical protein
VCGVVIVAVVVEVVVGVGGVWCAFLVLFLSGVWSFDMAMASLVSSSNSLQASADAASVVRSYAFIWSTVSSVGVVDGGMEETANGLPNFFIGCSPRLCGCSQHGEVLW